MKHAKHQDRKSFRKWAMPGQRMETQAASELADRRIMAAIAKRNVANVGRNNGPIKHSVPAQNNSTQYRCHRRSILSHGSNRFGTRFNTIDIRPRRNNLKETQVSINRLARYAIEPSGALVRIQ